MKDIISEKDLERTFSEKLNRTKKVWVIKLLSTFIKGLPDRMILCQGGYVGFAEIKTTGKKPTKIQEHIISRIRKVGFTVMVVDSPEAYKKAVLYIDKLLGVNIE